MGFILSLSVIVCLYVNVFANIMRKMSILFTKRRIVDARRIKYYQNMDTGNSCIKVYVGQIDGRR